MNDILDTKKESDFLTRNNFPDFASDKYLPSASLACPGDEKNENPSPPSPPSPPTPPELP